MLKHLGLLLASSCALVPEPVEAAPAFVAPALAIDISNGVNADILINNLPLTRHELAQHSPVPDTLKIPPYYFRNGTNTITIRYTAWVKSYPDAKLDIIVGNQLAKLNPKTFAGCDDGDFDKRCELTARFELTGVPAWAWATSKSKIADTDANRDALKKAYVKLHDRIMKAVPRDEDGLPKHASKSVLAKFRKQMLATMPEWVASAKLEPATEMDDFVMLASHPRSGLDDLPWWDDSVKFELIGDGTHARMWRQRIPIIYFQGGAHDAPRGEMGPFSIAFDIWWRLEGGAFVPVAMWRTGPMVKLP